MITAVNNKILWHFPHNTAIDLYVVMNSFLMWHQKSVMCTEVLFCTALWFFSVNLINISLIINKNSSYLKFNYIADFPLNFSKNQILQCLSPHTHTVQVYIFEIWINKTYLKYWDRHLKTHNHECWRHCTGWPCGRFCLSWQK